MLIAAAESSSTTETSNEYFFSRKCKANHIFTQSGDSRKQGKIVFQHCKDQTTELTVFRTLLTTET